MPKTTAPNLDLKRERLRQQMSRSKLARHTGTSRKTLLFIEDRRTRPRLETAGRIAKALDCEITDLFDPEEVIG